MNRFVKKIFLCSWSMSHGIIIYNLKVVAELWLSDYFLQRPFVIFLYKLSESSLANGAMKVLVSPLSLKYLINLFLRWHGTPNINFCCAIKLFNVHTGALESTYNCHESQVTHLEMNREGTNNSNTNFTIKLAPLDNSRLCTLYSNEICRGFKINLVA